MTVKVFVYDAAPEQRWGASYGVFSMSDDGAVHTDLRLIPSKDRLMSALEESVHASRSYEREQGRADRVVLIGAPPSPRVSRHRLDGQPLSERLYASVLDRFGQVSVPSRDE